VRAWGRVPVGRIAGYAAIHQGALGFGGSEFAVQSICEPDRDCSQ
jgi:hypothetical protein